MLQIIWNRRRNLEIVPKHRSVSINRELALPQPLRAGRCGRSLREAEETQFGRICHGHKNICHRHKSFGLTHSVVVDLTPQQQGISSIRLGPKTSQCQGLCLINIEIRAGFNKYRINRRTNQQHLALARQLCGRLTPLARQPNAMICFEMSQKYFCFFWTKGCTG